MALLSPSHRTSFDPHSTGIKATWLINSLTDHVIDMRGRGYKAMSGNCCIEVKGRAKGQTTITVTRNEMGVALLKQRCCIGKTRSYSKFWFHRGGL